jgi:pimeloyl-ACP methyl ester carboxylesterase
MVRAIDVDGRPTRCRIVRTKPATEKNVPLTVYLLIHGISCSSEAWAPLLQHVRSTLQDQKLAKENNCVGDILYIAPDLPGFGYTPLHEDEKTKNMNQLADFCFRLLKKFVEQDTVVHVVGNSMGCQVAMAMARRWSLHKTNLNSLILVGPTTGGHESIISYMLKLGVDSFLETLSYNLTLLWMFWREGFIHYMQTVWHMVNDFPLQDMPLHATDIDSKQNERFIMLVRGENDSISTNNVKEAYQNGIVKSLKLEDLSLDVDNVIRVEQVAGQAHAVQFNGPSELISLFADFMSETQRSQQ